MSKKKSSKKESNKKEVKKETKGKEINVLELDKKLANLPHTSDEYQKVLQKIQKAEKDYYGDQHILCIETDALREKRIPTALFGSKESYEELCRVLKFNEFNMFNDVSSYQPRYMVEYDYRYKQVLTFGYITNKDRTEFILLRKNQSNRLGMIGGHTDFHISAYAGNPEKFLINNLYKELFEEVKIFRTVNGQEKQITNENELWDTVTAKMVVNDYNDHYKLRNIGFIYEIYLDVPKLDEMFRFESNEPHIHTVEKVTLKEIKEATRYHSMLKAIVAILTNSEPVVNWLNPAYY